MNYTIIFTEDKDKDGIVVMTDSSCTIYSCDISEDIERDFKVLESLLS